MTAAPGGRVAHEVVRERRPAVTRVLRLARRMLRLARSIPVAWVVTALVVAASVTRLALKPGRARGGIDAFVATGYDAVFVHHDWASTLTSVFFVRALPALPVIAIVVLVGVGWAERRFGHLRTIVAFVVVTVVGILLGLGVQALGLGLDLYAAEVTRTYRTVDPVIAVVGVVMAASAFAGPLLRRRVRVVLFLAVLVFVLYSGHPSDLYRLFAAIVGLVLGMLMHRAATGRASAGAPGVVPRATRRETRTLLAAVVAVTALGPLVSIVSPSGPGILNPLGVLFRDPLRDYAAAAVRCETATLTKHCAEVVALSRLDGPGAVLLTLLPLLALLIAAWGIQRGHRVALWLAIGVNVVSAVLAAVYFGFIPLVASDSRSSLPARLAEDHLAFEVVSAAVPLLIAVLLVSSRWLLPARSDGSDGALRFLARVTALFVVVAAVYFVVAALARDQFTPTASLGDLLLDLPERFVPTGFLALEPADILPEGPVAVIATQWVGPLFWIGVVVMAVLGMRPHRPRGGESDDSRVRSLLHTGDGATAADAPSTLSWMATWPGHHYWFSPEGGAVAYRVVNAVAITTGDPIGPRSAHPSTALGFAAYCIEHGWTPVFYSATDAVRRTLREAGWSSLQVAEDTVVSTAGWSLDGKRMQDLRSSINRADREGVHAEWVRFGELGAATRAQITEISEFWVAEKGLPEMGFTLGGVDELTDPEVRLMVAVDAEGSVQGVTSWLPTFQQGEVTGWTLDFMRRRPDGMNGVMEFLIARTIQQAQLDGVSFVSLSAAPLATSGDDAPGVLSYLSRVLEPVYGFRSLMRFKAKFRPEHRPLHLCCPDPLALPGIGYALGRAYLPTTSTRQAVRALRVR
ncbi:bifunctional lysylphosphatidylglycerol flippase/synthetase MprF [Herbiconiux sp. A18JL235]|uniref:Bifunctional lysylphosphatidylglycerol flippase/synthetase MprF n=1 Tax=Herbiconiux sp. A18JL235 TaxID=3152363 RepID=A0AB39BD91_9MICO